MIDDSPKSWASPVGIGIGLWFSRELTFSLIEEQEVVAIQCPPLYRLTLQKLNYSSYKYFLVKYIPCIKDYPCFCKEFHAMLVSREVR